MKKRNITPFLVLTLLGGILGIVVAIRYDVNDSTRPTALSHPESNTLKFSLRRGSTSEVPSDITTQAPEKPHSKSTLPAQGEKSAKSDATTSLDPAGLRPAATSEPTRDPFARAALAYVGVDPDADEYWIAAINNPNLSVQERRDLIEDLNEAGLSDPKHPTLDDLPMILARLQLIEELGPDAMDRVNAAAFQEVYRDLMNLADVAMGGGTPVR